MKKIITSESVNIGHPDKTCDYISDAFLDEALSQDSNAMMAVECAIKNDKLFIYGEATTSANIDYDTIAKNCLKEIGYTNEFTIIKEISSQSPDIHQAVNKRELSANDQGIVFGYACDETRELMPLPIMMANRCMKIYDDYRRTTDFLLPDAKCQVSVSYEGDIPVHVDTLLISASHTPNTDVNDVRIELIKNVASKLEEEFPRYITTATNFIFNPSNKFTIWGSFGDSGCVGRKIVVDTYGGVGHVGGGCFSSKNATKVDRSGAYYARYIAKNIVAHHLARRCEVSLSFGIGISKPIDLYIDTFGTEYVELKKIYDYVNKNFDLSLSNIINELDLLKPIYKRTACYGHFGREEFNWEKIKI